MKKEWQIRFEDYKYTIIFSNFSNGSKYSEARGLVKSNEGNEKYSFFVREECNQAELENKILCLPSSGSGLRIEELAKGIINKIEHSIDRGSVLTIEMLKP